MAEVESDIVAEQFEDAEQQLEASMLGMWTFLATEILFFGVLFVSFELLRLRWHEAFAQGSRELLLWAGGINTAVLLTSSLLVALMVRAAKLGNNKQVIWLLLGAIVLGVAFLGIKATEYYVEAQEHLVPGINFSTIPPHEAHLPPEQQHPRPDPQRLFMLFYFIMTGFHALHMIAGIGVLSVMAVLTWRGHFSPEYHNPLEISGLYWHFVDVVWIFLYPCLYLLKWG